MRLVVHMCTHLEVKRTNIIVLMWKRSSLEYLVHNHIYRNYAMTRDLSCWPCKLSLEGLDSEAPSDLVYLLLG